MTTVFAMHIDLLNEMPAKLSIDDIVPPHRMARLLAYKNRADYNRGLAAELLLYYALNKEFGLKHDEFTINRTEKGKPYLTDHEDIHFSISHSGDYAAVALSGKECGIDIERIRPVSFDLVRRFFSDREIAFLERFGERDFVPHFFELWSAKESYLKMLGYGLTRPLSSFTVIKDEQGNFVFECGLDNESPCLKTYDFAPDYKVAVCSRDKNCKTQIHLVKKGVWENFI